MKNHSVHGDACGAATLVVQLEHGEVLTHVDVFAVDEHEIREVAAVGSDGLAQLELMNGTYRRWTFRTSPDRTRGRSRPSSSGDRHGDPARLREAPPHDVGICVGAVRSRMSKG
jgi:hypothetical protein